MWLKIISLMPFKNCLSFCMPRTLPAASFSKTIADWNKNIASKISVTKWSCYGTKRKSTGTCSQARTAPTRGSHARRGRAARSSEGICGHVHFHCSVNLGARPHLRETEWPLGDGNHGSELSWGLRCARKSWLEDSSKMPPVGIKRQALLSWEKRPRPALCHLPAPQLEHLRRAARLFLQNADTC